MDEVTLREISPRDWLHLSRLDASYETDQTFQAQCEQDGSLRLSPQPLPERQRRGFDIDLRAPEWTRGWLIESGGTPVGFLATQYALWNQRLTVWHFYVDRQHRRRGLGRRLMDCALEEATRLQARSVWVETSNDNQPGIAAYRRLGFEICGYDQSLYYGTSRSGEFAVFLWKRLS